jgi:hypothetical protein
MVKQYMNERKKSMDEKPPAGWMKSPPQDKHQLHQSLCASFLHQPHLLPTKNAH